MPGCNGWAARLLESVGCRSWACWCARSRPGRLFAESLLRIAQKVGRPDFSCSERSGLPGGVREVGPIKLRCRAGILRLYGPRPESVDCQPGARLRTGSRPGRLLAQGTRLVVGHSFFAWRAAGRCGFCVNVAGGARSRAGRLPVWRPGSPSPLSMHSLKPLGARQKSGGPTSGVGLCRKLSAWSRLFAGAGVAFRAPEMTWLGAREVGWADFWCGIGSSDWLLWGWAAGVRAAQEVDPADFLCGVMAPVARRRPGGASGGRRVRGRRGWCRSGGCWWWSRPGGG